MKNKQLRRVVVFLSCLSLILSLALPVFAEDTTDAGTFLTVALPSDIVVSSIINGIGVIPGQNTSEYKSVVDRCVEYLIQQGKVINQKIEVWQRQQVGDYSLWKYGADVSLVELIRSWLFDNDIVSLYPEGIIKSGPYEGSYLSQTFMNRLALFAGYEYVSICFSTGKNWYILGCDSPFSFDYVSDMGGYLASTSDGVKIRYNVQSLAGTVQTGSATSVGYFTGWDLSFPYATEPGLETAFLAPSSLPFADAYPQWNRNSIAVPLPGAIPGTDEDVIIVPIAPGDTVDDTLTIPQEDVWTGAGTITDNPAIPDTGTLSDILSAVLSLPRAIVSSITEALSKFFGINGAADSFGISLTDFFPFCIPFDIFDFLSVLSADPVAPVFHWELPVPQLGRTFEIDVDLSAWDPVAAVFRTFELLAFIVGLGMVTREKFLRS